MWPFKKKKAGPNEKPAGIICVHCGGEDTIIISDTSSESSSPVKVWRGERYVTYKCRSCQRLFYSEEPSGGIANNSSSKIIEDEDQLRNAEEELKRITDNEDDRRYLPGKF
jgi:DNA-directed RNA polymerase subunit RPC12/RpoP